MDPACPTPQSVDSRPGHPPCGLQGPAVLSATPMGPAQPETHARGVPVTNHAWPCGCPLPMPLVQLVVRAHLCLCHETGEAAPSGHPETESWRPSAPTCLPATEAGEPGPPGPAGRSPSP